MTHVKCVAIRDMQLSEKADIAQKAREEEARLDAMMEQDRVAELERIRRREIERHEGTSYQFFEKFILRYEKGCKSTSCAN